MMIPSPIKINPERCEEYWWRYFDLLEKNKEYYEVLKISLEKADQVKKEMEIITAKMEEHLNCCEYCQAWLKSF